MPQGIFKEDTDSHKHEVAAAASEAELSRGRMKASRNTVFQTGATVALTSLCLAACSRGGEPGASIVLRDSAGIQISELPSLELGDVPQWRTRRRFSTRDAGIDFFKVAAGVFLPDSSLLLADGGNSELFLLSADGGITHRSGRKGEGPGEYEWILNVGTSSAGRVWIHDGSLARITWLDQRLKVLRTQRVTTDKRYTSIRVLTVLDDGRVAAVYQENRNVFRSLGVQRDTVPVLIYGSGGELVDTAGLWLGEEVATETFRGGYALLPVGFGRRFLADGNGNMLVFGDTEALEVQVLDGFEPTLIIRSEDESESVTEEQAADWRNEIRSLAPVEVLGEAWANAPVRETLPAFGDLKLDPSGRIWIGSYAQPSADRRTWVVFEKTGKPIGRLELPTYLQRPMSRSEVIAIGEGLIALKLRGEYDVEYVEVWSFQKR